MKNWKSYKKGMGIKVKIPNDLDEFDNQKYRPSIVIKSYPSHIKVQLLSTQPSKNDYYKIILNNRTAYIRPIYHVTISIFYLINKKLLNKFRRRRFL